MKIFYVDKMYKIAFYEHSENVTITDKHSYTADDRIKDT